VAKPLPDEKRESIIELLDKGEKNQTEIAEEVGVSQSTVSELNRSVQNIKEKSMMEGYEKGFTKAMDFSENDSTERSEDDDYWCAYCENEDEGKVMIDYMTETCPNGHDLSNDW